MGATFKEDVSDIRNSRVSDIISELKSYGVHVDVVDPFASSKELKHEYGFELVPKVATDYDAIIVAVSHEPYLQLTEDYFKSISKPGAILFDIKGIYRKKIKELAYLSL
jgi:UDP-N-acetyl-D-galactosamine dehydrogenase